MDGIDDAATVWLAFFLVDCERRDAGGDVAFLNVDKEFERRAVDAGG